MVLKIENLNSYNGNKVPNQFRIETDKNIYFQSYNTIICRIVKATKKVYITLESTQTLTTSRFSRYFLANENIYKISSMSQLQELIDAGKLKKIKEIKKII